MTDVQSIISNIEHGFQKYNPFYEHNYRLTLRRIENDFTRQSALENKDFARMFRRYTNLVKAPVDFIMHIVKNAMYDEKPRGTLESVKRSLGNDYTAAWSYDPKSNICILYTSIYYNEVDRDEPVRLKYGLLLQWKDWNLGKVEKVELGSGKRTSLFDTDSLFTTSSMRYSILQVSRKLTDHIERAMFGNKIRTLMLDQVCSAANWEPAARFLKHHTGDYRGVDTMFMEALLKERETGLEYIKPDDVTRVSKALLATMDSVIRGCSDRFYSESEFLESNDLEYAIIYGANSSLYYTWWSHADNCYYFLEVNDTRNLVGLYSGAKGVILENISRINIADVLRLINDMKENGNERV